MNKALSKAVAVAFVLAYPPGLQAQSTQARAAYPLPVEVGDGEFIPSGVYLNMSFTKMDEPVTAILSETFERETPRKVLADILRAIRDDDFDAFAARLDHEDGTDAQEVFDYLKAWITDWNDVVHNRTLEFAGLTYFVLDGDGLRVLAIPIPIIERHGKAVMSWQLAGHNIIQPVNVFLRAIEDSPNDFGKQNDVAGAVEVVIRDPFGVGSKESARLLVTGSRMSYSIRGFRDRSERIPDHVSRGALSVYKASYDALAAKDKAGYLSTMDEKSGGGQESQWERMVDLDSLDEFVLARTPRMRIGAVITGGPLTIFFRQSGLRDSPTQPEFVLEDPPGTFRRIKVSGGGPLKYLLKWDRFLQAFETALTLQEK